ncbi:MAG: serine hydrolase [Roseivirga sp.]|nr:serine hydrolase [Roseivirga sp.]
MKKPFLILFLFVNSLVQGQDRYQYQPPELLGDSWQISEATDEGLKTELFEKFFNALGAQEHKMHSMLIVKNGKLVMEEYFNGYDQGKRQDLRSVTKSVISLLVGIAIEKGRIKSVDDPISHYLPRFRKSMNADPDKQLITIRHLLTMSSGMDCNDWDKKSAGQEDKLYKKKNWLDHMAGLSVIHAPGSESYYCTGGVMLLARILEFTSGMDWRLQAEEYLFKPIGINDVAYGHTSKKQMPSEAQRLYMRPRDVAKLGHLVLNWGQWEGKQLVPASWIEQISFRKTQISGVDYSYLWWKLPFEKNGMKVDATCATGNGGQYLLVFPEHDLVAVFTGGAYNSEEDKLPFAIVNRVILPSLSR